MRGFCWLFVALIRACTDCKHYRPFDPRPTYLDMGKCAMYKDPKYANGIGYAEEARQDPSRCGKEGAWFLPEYPQRKDQPKN